LYDESGSLRESRKGVKKAYLVEEEVERAGTWEVAARGAAKGGAVERAAELQQRVPIIQS